MDNDPAYIREIISANERLVAEYTRLPAYGKGTAHPNTDALHINSDDFQEKCQALDTEFVSTLDTLFQKKKLLYVRYKDPRNIEWALKFTDGLPDFWVSYQESIVYSTDGKVLREYLPLLRITPLGGDIYYIRIEVSCLGYF